MVEKDPHTGTGNFVVNYEAGRLVFDTAPAAAPVCTYHYAQSSEFTIVPRPSTKLIVNLAEIQFSTDFVMNDSVVYAVYGYIDVFAPQLLQANGGPYPPLTKVPLKSFVYKRVPTDGRQRLARHPAIYRCV
jgi:hypothetical protein